MKYSIVQPHNVTKDLMSYLGSSGRSSHSDRDMKDLRATDSFGEMFNSLMSNRESIHSRDSLRDSRTADTLKDLQKDLRDEPLQQGKAERAEDRKEETTLKTGENDRETKLRNEDNRDRTTANADSKTDKQKALSESGEKKLNKSGDKKRDEEQSTDISSLQEKISSLITLLQNMKEGSEEKATIGELKKELHSLIQKLTADINSMDQKNVSQGDMKKLTSLKQILENMEKELARPEGRLDSKKTAALLEELQKSAPQKETKGHAHTQLAAHSQQKADQTQEIKQTEVKDTLVAVEAEKNEASQGKTGDNSSFSFKDQDMSSSIHKNLSRAASQEKPASLFREQVNELINRSRMVMQDRQNGSITLKMYPERLGNVSVHLGLENGTLTGSFLVESQEAKDVLLANMEQLRERLEEEGITFGNFHVNVRDERSFAGHQENDSEENEIPSAYQLENASQEYSYSGNYSHSGSLNLII